MDIILIVLIILVFCGGGYGFRTGGINGWSPFGLILLIVVLYLLFGNGRHFI